MYIFLIIATGIISGVCCYLQGKTDGHKETNAIFQDAANKQKAKLQELQIKEQQQKIEEQAAILKAIEDGTNERIKNENKPKDYDTSKFF